MSIQRTGGIPLSALSPKFLHSNSTSHTWPFSAIAELIDNAYDPDVMAKQLWIDWTRIKGSDCLTFQDTGSGMTNSAMYKMLSFGFSKKQAVKGHAAVGLYGNGFKSSSMRLGRDAIVFSKTRDTMSVGLLSQSYLESIAAEHVVVPIVTIGHDGQSPDEDTVCRQNILNHSPFNTVEELLAELNAITSISFTGTRIIIWNLRRVEGGGTEFDLSTDRYDIRIPKDACEMYKHRNVTQSVPEILYSLRAYCSILYLKPRMQIIIRGQKVKTQLISKSLAITRKDQYRPFFLNKRIPITFGYNIKSKDHYGMMMYHKNRLIKAFERVGCQRKGDYRGVGVIGVIECNFLQPTHNKQDFDDTAEYRKTMNILAVKLEEYWEEIRFERKNCKIPAEDSVKSPDQNWVQCDDCQKWRRLPDGIDSDKLPDEWFCRMNPDPQYRICHVEEEPEDSEDESYSKPYKKQRRMSKMLQKKDEQQIPAPAMPLPATSFSDSEQRRPPEGAATGLSFESFTHPSCSGHNLPSDTMLMDCEDHVSTTPKRMKMQQKRARKQIPAPAMPLPATPLSDRERRRPPEGATTGLSSESFTRPSCSGYNLPIDTMLMDCEDHVSTTPQRVKQVPLHAVGISPIDTKDKELAAPSVPPMIPASIQVSIRQQETQGESWAAEVLEENGPQSPMLKVQQQPDGLLDTYKKQVIQLQQELEEMKCKCNHLQATEIELQRRLEDMEVKNSSLSSQCEQLNRELQHLRPNGGTGSPSTGEKAQDNVNISQEETCRKLRNLRQRIGRLLVTFVPTLALEDINLDSELMDEILEKFLNEVTEV